MTLFQGTTIKRELETPDLINNIHVHIQHYLMIRNTHTG